MTADSSFASDRRADTTISNRAQAALSGSLQSRTTRIAASALRRQVLGISSMAMTNLDISKATIKAMPNSMAHTYRDQVMSRRAVTRMPCWLAPVVSLLVD